MQKFTRRNTMRTLEIEGNIFEVDFGRDEISLAIKKLEVDAVAVQEAFNNITDVGKREQAIIAEQKRLYRETIDCILGVGASEKIFRDGDSQVFYADVYLFIVKGFTDANTSNAPHASNKAQRRAKK